VGWQRKLTGRRWAPLGTRVGWLISGAGSSYQVTQELARAEPIPVDRDALRRDLLKGQADESDRSCDRYRCDCARRHRAYYLNRTLSNPQRPHL
jgi:hypothetical protein